MCRHARALDETGERLAFVSTTAGLWISEDQGDSWACVNPVVVYDKAKADGIVLEKLGTERLWLALKPIWPEDRPHLSVSEIADWFAAYVYLPRLRDRVVLESAIRDAVAKLDPQFGYADGFDEATGQYRKLIWAQMPPELLSSTAVLVREVEAKRQLSVRAAASPTPSPTPPGSGPQQPFAGTIFIFRSRKAA